LPCAAGAANSRKAAGCYLNLNSQLKLKKPALQRAFSLASLRELIACLVNPSCQPHSLRHHSSSIRHQARHVGLTGRFFCGHNIIKLTFTIQDKREELLYIVITNKKPHGCAIAAGGGCLEFNMGLPQAAKIVSTSSKSPHTRLSTPRS
jgi:hypothetical protein